MAICFIVDRHSYYEVLKMLDKIWVETLGRISELEKRLALIEEIAQEPLDALKSKKWVDGSTPDAQKETFPEQQQRKAKEAIEGHKPDKVFTDGVEQEPGQSD